MDIRLNKQNTYMWKPDTAENFENCSAIYEKSGCLQEMMKACGNRPKKSENGKKFLPKQLRCINWQLKSVISLLKKCLLACQRF